MEQFFWSPRGEIACARRVINREQQRHRIAAL
jgi:hypothetical protein